MLKAPPSSALFLSLWVWLGAACSRGASTPQPGARPEVPAATSAPPEGKHPAPPEPAPPAAAAQVAPDPAPAATPEAPAKDSEEADADDEPDDDVPFEVVPRKGKTDPVWLDRKVHSFVLAALSDERLMFQPADGGGPVPIPDGAIVERRPPAPAGSADFGSEQDDEGGGPVSWQGRLGTLVGGHVIERAKLKPIKTGGGLVHLAVFIAGCGDVCHTEAWLLFADGTRLSVDDDAVRTVIAVSPDGLTLALGSRVLVLVDLRARAAQVLQTFTSPAWAPDGSLWVRDAWAYMDEPASDCFGDDAAPDTACDPNDPDELAASGDRVWRLAAKAPPELIVALPGRLPMSSPGEDAPPGPPVSFKKGVATAVFARSWKRAMAKQACAVCERRPAEALACRCAPGPGEGKISVRLTLAPAAPLKRP